MKKYGLVACARYTILPHTYKSWNLCLRCCWGTQPISLRRRPLLDVVTKKGSIPKDRPYQYSTNYLRIIGILPL